MGRKIKTFFTFVYKTILFIILIPIKIVKYVCMGFFFTSAVLIELLVYSVVFLSFFLYKLLKYFVLFFSFPVMIYNCLTRNKKRTVLNNSNDKEEVIENIIQESDDKSFNEQNNDITEEGIVYVPTPEMNVAYEEIPDEVKKIELNEVVNDNTSVGDTTEIKAKKEVQPDNVIEFNNNENQIEFNNMDNTVNEDNIEVDSISINTNDIKNKTKFNLLKGILVLFKYICFPVYKIFKYIVYGIGFILLVVFKVFRLLSFILYKTLKYLLLSLTFPIMLINIIGRSGSTSKKHELKEEVRLRKQEEKFKKQLLAQNRQEEKLRKQLAKKKMSEEYVNEKVKLEKKSFKEKFNDSLNSFFSFPKKMVDSFQNSIKNSVFAKNAKNKRDINRQALLINFEGEDAEKSDVKLVYQYTAKNKDGKIVTDYFEAFSKVEVHSFLLSEGFEVYNIKTNSWIQFLHKSSAGSKVRIKNKDLIFFLTQLSTYIKAGIPLVESLKILARQYSKNKSYQKVFRTIIYDLTMGENFSTALSKQGNAFPKILINMVKASEMTGELPEVLDDMANYFDEMDKTRKQMITALMYPMIVLVISIAVIIFILLFVIPKFVTIYESMDASQIPAFTLFVLSVSDFLKKYIFILLGGTALFAIVMIYLYKNVKVFRTLMQWVAMHLPVFGNVIIYNEVAIFTKTFASLLSHNVFITDSMEILTKVTDNEIYKMLILDTITNLAKGEKISTSFKDHWAFPIPAYEMLVTGEKTGQLAEMMAKVASYYQELHKNSVTRIKTFIEPILIIFLTVVVGAIVLSIVIPMFSMYQSVQNYS